jgi:hypothetical protein
MKIKERIKSLDAEQFSPDVLPWPAGIVSRNCHRYDPPAIEGDAPVKSVVLRYYFVDDIGAEHRIDPGMWLVRDGLGRVAAVLSNDEFVLRYEGV